MVVGDRGLCRTGPVVRDGVAQFRGYDEAVGPDRTTWFVALVLFGEHALALAEGTRTLDRGARPDRAEWHGIVT
ncbi:hypothetical protein OG753_07110 [Streptomyces sp. NBC_00029]|uniref:hypothetical protein n=1 Tax=Streptomyces sp. NBC_00029 TaxID=2903613 RepID=UPI003248F94A